MGNTTKALTKAYAMACVGLSAMVIFVTYLKIAGLLNINSDVLPLINIADPKILIGLFAGGALPFLFAALAIAATGRTAFLMVDEVRRQFRENKGTSPRNYKG
jgi:K(+)-stimulated pyrophosphate-energized sodium pump